MPAAPAARPDAARALLEMLESGQSAPAPVHLRDLAAQLVAEVEARRADSGTPARDEPGDVARAPARHSPEGRAPRAADDPRAAGRLTLRPPRAPDPMPAADAPGAPAPESADSRRLFSKAAPMALPAAASPRSRLTLSLPRPLVAEDRSTPALAPGHSPEDVRKIVAAARDPQGLGREHPAIIAIGLEDRSPRDQAAALRKLGGGQVRAVHRALRQLAAADR
ncbi:hypothetical protein [Jannaschia ovalis]|uniref:Uncharacterized protein n=1 Tax=Jannaschia ovalis TaxID=3038773 RepID=A0ABY8LHL9_9RHOB|nr:hypothetical protein [Jannaschia sp. GRR-S6-38]WGH80162.1 hypothetical protein P8627_07825 [Jannaschia sp. GRR-S6-38]